MAVDAIPRGAPGIPVDAGGGPTIDPTKNVLDLVAAAVRREDDLREAERRFNATEIAHVKELARLRAGHSREIRILDADRLEKVRQVDQLNADRLAQQIRDAVDTLATTTAATAETLRNQGAATAAVVAGQTERIVNPILERLAALERASYTGQGRQAIADPQMERLAALVDKLATSQSTSTGNTAGRAATWAAVGSLILLLLALAGFFGLRSQQPEIRYLPAPTAQTAPAAPR